jgi:hypothetical protein
VKSINSSELAAPIQITPENVRKFIGRLLPKVDINTQISESSSIVNRMMREFGAAFNHVVLVSSHISATQMEQK